MTMKNPFPYYHSKVEHGYTRNIPKREKCFLPFPCAELDETEEEILDLDYWKPEPMDY
jgi:hypothetical protein